MNIGIFIIFAIVSFTTLKRMNGLWHDSDLSPDSDAWWHYKEGVIGGPSHWGQTAFMAVANDVWPACYQGKMQSPVSISTEQILFDPNLTPLKILGADTQIDVEVVNTGQDLQVKVIDPTTSVIFSGGPLVYDYKFFGALIKFGSISNRGSDHQINGVAFPAELQLYAFNFDLYPNYSSALSKPNGLAAVSIFCKIGDRSTPGMAALLSATEHVQLKGQFKRLHGLLLNSILPSNFQYITYQGSLPFPACHETVTWILLNHPILITEEQLKSLRKLRIGPFRESGSMADNYRTIQSLNSRSLRTNIQFVDMQPYCSLQTRISYKTAESLP
ncbi:unnamed protein product [Trichobilharzia szidati]|nr:unnamed protein product [Trichobilharzia szidati]